MIPAKAQINTDRVMAIGKNALFFEDYVLSIQYFNQVIKAKPYLADPYLFRGVAKFSLDDYKGAEQDLNMCIERNPFLWYAYQCRGAARQSLGDYKGAIEDYNNALKFRPESKQVLINKSITYLQMKDFDSAVTTLDTLLRQQPKYMEAYLTRGAAYAGKGDTIQAFTDYNQAISLDPHYAPAYAQRAMLYFQSNNYAGAEKDFDEAIRLETKQIGYHINRGLVRYYQNDLRGAMADYDHVIQLDAQNTIALFNRGLLRSNVGDVYGAIEDFSQVIQLEPDNFMAIYNRAILNEEAKHYKETVADLNLVLKEYPNFIPGYYFRSQVKRKMNDVKGADRDFWNAYDLEQSLKKQQAKGKIVTGKEIRDANQEDDEDDKTREKSDKSIEKFNRMVVYDKTEEERSQFKNEIRGRVQDKQVSVDLKPQFVITYYERPEAIDQSAAHFNKTIADYNRKELLKLQLKVTDNESSLTDDQAEFHFRSIDEYSLQLVKTPDNRDAYFGRALDYMVLQDLSEAIADYSRVIELDSTFLMAYFNRAVERSKQMEVTDYKDGNETLSLSISKNSNPYTSNLAAPLKKELNETQRNYDFERILKDYETVIRLNPDFAEAYYNRGNIRCLQRDFRAAIAEYNKAIERNSDFAEAYYNRGLAYLYLGNTERGIADLSKAGELGIVDSYGIIKKMTTD
jgi:tetratricopeptide (TPR) repeat protein